MIPEKEINYSKSVENEMKEKKIKLLFSWLHSLFICFYHE